jgi:hypothetical protein
MKKVNMFLVAAVLTVAVYSLSAPAYAWQNAPSQASAQQQPSDSNGASSATEEKAFTGKIMKAGSKLVLQDSTSGTSYQLDDQEKAKPYQNKQVKVTGTLDASSGVIHVSSIEAVAS